VERILAIGRDCAAHLEEPLRSIDHGDLLYDEKTGLPRDC
jgi:antitoxin VapB